MAKEKELYFHYAHKIRIYPSNVMKRYLEQCFGYRRYCWNFELSLYNNSREEGNTPLSINKCYTEHTKVKKDWEYTMPDYIRSDTNRNLKDAFDQYHTSKKKGKPHNHKKNRAYGSFIIPSDRIPKNPFIVRNKHSLLKLPCSDKCPVPKRMRFIKLSEDLNYDPNKDIIAEIIIMRDVDKYYAAFSIKTQTPLPQSEGTGSVGIDPGVKTLATLSTGETFNYPKRKLKKLDKQIRKMQSHMGHSQHRNGRTGTNNWVKAKTKLTKLYQKVRFIKEDVIKKATTNIVKKYKDIAVEINDVSAMQQLNKRNPKRTNKSKHTSNKNLTEASISLFTRTLKQKCEMRGCNFIRISPRKASTQTCSKCGYRRIGNEKLTPKDRIYTCPVCGHIEDRDLNAAKNIHKFGMQTISPTQGNGSSSQ